MNGDIELSAEGRGTASPYPKGLDPLDKIAEEGRMVSIEDTNEVQEDAVEQSDLDAEMEDSKPENAAELIGSALIDAAEKKGISADDLLNKIISGLGLDEPMTVEEDLKPGQEPVLEETEGREDPMPSEPQKAPFDPLSVQNPLRPTDGPEGGVIRTSAKGPTMSSVDNKNAGGMLKPTADMMADARPNKYEMSGFEAEYEMNGMHHRVHIRDYFDDLKSAQATITGDKYLMPMPGGSFKLAKISGTPTISFNEREIISIKNGEWQRK